MGDLLLSLPAVKMIREGNPKVKITLFCDDSNVQLAELINLFDEVVNLNRTRNSYLSMLLGMWRYGGKFDAIIALKGGYGRQNSLAALLLRPGVSISYVKNHQLFAYFSERWVTDRMQLSDRDYHELHYSTLVLNLILKNQTTSIPASQFWPCQRDFNSVFRRARNETRTPVILIPVVDDHDPRMPSVPYWSKLLRLLSEMATDAFEVALCCRHCDQRVAARILESTNLDMIQIITPPNIKALLDVIDNCDICLGGDGGTVHMAASFKKHLFLFTESSKIQKWSPLSERLVTYPFEDDVNEISTERVASDVSSLLFSLNNR